jgi:hypothetical protein
MARGWTVLGSNPISYAEQPSKPLSVLALDFAHAFDRMSHVYLFKYFNQYGLDDSLVACIMNLYANATSSVNVNGRLYGPIALLCEVRQSCPLSMLLYSLGLRPFLRLLENQLPGIRIGRSKPFSVVAFADDVTLFLTSVDDLQLVKNAITMFERASGARLNARKSMALPVGPWRSLNC